jgi:putative ABC transport system permease protein
MQYSLAALRSVEPNVSPTRYLVRLRGGANPDAVARSLHATLGSGAEISINVPQDTSETDAFTRAFNLVTFLVIIVALAFLGSTMLLGVRERTHDLGVLRAVGFTPRQVATITLISAILLAGIGIVIGVPVGLAAYRALADGVGKGSGIGPGIGEPTPAGRVIVALAALLAVSGALGIAVSRRAATAHISELVREE